MAGFFLNTRNQSCSLLISDVNIAFQQAARNILLENEPLLQRFTLELKMSRDAGQCWNKMR